MGVKFDYKQAYNKNLKPSARLHYLENARHDQDSPAKKIGPQGLGVKGNNGYTVGSPAKKSCSPMNKYGSPMKMGSHAIHKHMGGSPFLASKNPDLEYMPVVEDSTGKRKEVTKVSGASIKSDSTTEIIKSKPTKKEAPKSRPSKSERKAKSLDRKAKRAKRAEASGNTQQAARLKRSAQRKKDRLARKNM
jgi:hypothetical protein